MSKSLPNSVTELTDQLRTVGYLSDRGLSTALHISLQLGRPLLLEGEVGVGKTELAKVLAQLLDRRLIRLQCYEGIDTNKHFTNGTMPAKCCKFAHSPKQNSLKIKP